MVTGFDARTDLFEQFAGYFGLEDLDLDAYRARTVPIDVILGRDRTQKSKVVKQADVIALSALLHAPISTPFSKSTRYRIHETPVTWRTLPLVPSGTPGRSATERTLAWRLRATGTSTAVIGGQPGRRRRTG